MKDDQINRRKFEKRIKIFLALTILFIAGCSGDPVRVEFPISHPANPEAYEAEFISPQNPFQTDFAAMERNSTSDSMMEPKMRKKSSKQHMDHDMGHKKEIQSESKSTKKPDHRKDDNLHKEHSQ
jgi:hypothetical protein